MFQQFQSMVSLFSNFGGTTEHAISMGPGLLTNHMCASVAVNSMTVQTALQTEIQPEQQTVPQTGPNCESETEPKTVQKVRKTKHPANRERKQRKENRGAVPVHNPCRGS